MKFIYIIFYIYIFLPIKIMYFNYKKFKPRSKRKKGYLFPLLQEHRALHEGGGGNRQAAGGWTCYLQGRGGRYSTEVTLTRNPMVKKKECIKH